MPTSKNREYGTPIGAAEPGRASQGRPKAGPADSATIRQKLSERMAEKEPSQPVKSSQPSENPTKDLSLTTAAERLRTRKLVVDKAIQDAE